MLRANKTLQSLNLESNFITSSGVQALVDALRDNDTLTAIKIDNQVTITEMCVFSILFEVFFGFLGLFFSKVVRLTNLAGFFLGSGKNKIHYFLICYEPQ